jgi:methylmalonyl-CoA mutase N-terminal domain/subunit
MDPILAAVSVYATLGEVCTVLEKEFGRYQAPEVL